MSEAAPKGFPVDSGWLERMPDGSSRLFATENEYVEAFFEALKA